MKVVVTGGAGYVGWSVVHRLLAEPAITELLVLDNFRRGNHALLLTGKQTPEPKLRIVVEDLLNSRGLRKRLVGASVVCHLAAVAQSPFNNQSPHEFDQVNHWGTAELCYAIEELNIPRLVYLSSGAVYGFGSEPFKVTDTPRPVTAYGLSKLDGERQVLRLAKKHEISVLRSASVYGLNPCARFDTAINKFCLQAALGETLHIHGSGEQSWAFIHVEAIAKQVVAAVLGELSSGLYNLVDINLTINEIVEHLQAVNPHIEYTFVNRQQQIGHLQMIEGGSLPVVRDAVLPLEQTIAPVLEKLSLITGCTLSRNSIL